VSGIRVGFVIDALLISLVPVLQDFSSSHIVQCNNTWSTQHSYAVREWAFGRPLCEMATPPRIEYRVRIHHSCLV
jgi:hypothetical protein